MNRRAILTVFASSILISVPVQSALVPIAFSGYNQDVIVEATAIQDADVRGFITASMDGGAAENGGTFYQTGFVLASPTTGLPTGTIRDSDTGSGTFQLQLATENNAVLLNNTTPTATLTLATPAAYSNIAFYSATGNGSGTVTYTINFVGGATESGTFGSPDWFNSSPTAMIASGRVNNVETGSTDNVGGENPRIYEALLNVSNTDAPIESITLSRDTANGNTAVFALSGTVVPEPASAGLLATAALGFLARRRRQS